MDPGGLPYNVFGRSLQSFVAVHNTAPTIGGYGETGIYFMEKLFSVFFFFPALNVLQLLRLSSLRFTEFPKSNL